MTDEFVPPSLAAIEHHHGGGHNGGGWIVVPRGDMGYMINGYLMQANSMFAIGNIANRCENGHIACSSCSTKVRNKCPSCTLPIGYIRCRAVEKIIESVKISCRNFIYGCFDNTCYFNKDEHEKTCTFAPCSCPYLNCTFIGSVDQIDVHFTSEHPNIAKHFYFDNSFTIQINPTEKYVILQENGGLLFILNNMEFQSVGNVISVSCIKPSTFKIEFSYDVAARKGDFVVKLESVAVNVAKRVENSFQKRFLMVPRDFINACGKIKLEVHIFSPHPSTPPRVTNVRSGGSIRG